MDHVKTDGGRKDAGYKGSVGDCVIRAIAVATEQDYQTVYDDITAAVNAIKEFAAGENPAIIICDDGSTTFEQPLQKVA